MQHYGEADEQQRHHNAEPRERPQAAAVEPVDRHAGGEQRGDVDERLLEEARAGLEPLQASPRGGVAARTALPQLLGLPDNVHSAKTEQDNRRRRGHQQLPRHQVNLRGHGTVSVHSIFQDFP